MCNLWVLFFSPPSQLCCLLKFENSPKSHLWEGFLLFGNFSSFLTPSPARISIPNSFCLLYFVLPSLKENGLPFWVPGVLRQRSEVVLLNLLSVQMIFRWILGGRKWSPHPIPPSSSRIQPINFFKVSCQTNGLDNVREKLSIILTRAVKISHSQTVAPDKQH